MTERGLKNINDYSTFTNVFNFCHVFFTFLTFLFFLERFFTSMHQSAPVPSTVVINVCPGAETWTLLAADMKTLHGGFLWGVSDRLDIRWWTHVSNAQVLQRSGLSAIGYHRRSCLVMLHAWILDRVPALYMILCVWWWIIAIWPAGEDHQAALATSGSTWSRRWITPYRYLRCGDLRSQWVHGAAQLRNDDDDDDDTCSETACNTTHSSGLGC